MRRYGGPIPPSRTYGKTTAGWVNKSRNLWDEIEAEEEARRQREKELLEAEEKKRLEEEEERKRRKKEKKKERKRREAEEKERLAAESQKGDAVEGLVEGVSKLDMYEEDEVQRQVMQEAMAAAPSIDPSAETPPTSPEKDEKKEEEDEPPASSPKNKQRRATLFPTNPLSPRPITPQNVSSIAIETVPPTPGPPPPLPSTEDNLAIDNNENGDEGEAEEGKSLLLSRRPTTPLLTPDRRGGLRRKSSRLTLSPGTSRGVSPRAETPKLLLSNGTAAVGNSAEEVKMKGLADKHRERLSMSSMISVAVTPMKVKVGLAVGEYEVYSDTGEEEEKEGEKEQEKGAPQPMHDPAPGEAFKQEEREEEDDWSEWGKCTATEEELNQLLSLCTVNEVIDFSEHIQSELKSSTLSKLGEASYSEVFLRTPHTKSSPPPARTVLKIIPFGYPTQCPFKQIHDELLITVAMAPIPGFIGFHSAHIVCGPFPQHLLDLWDHWDQHVKAGGSENDRPDFYNETQLFAVIELEDGGRDLEAWSFKGEVEGEGGWREAREVFWRVAGALAKGEEEREFEHRDLHFGNIVIKKVPVGESEDEMLRNLSLGDEEVGKGGKAKSLMKKQQQKFGTPVMARSRLQVSLIDYTLSRARCANGLLSFTPLDDEALFEGKGDYQFDIYRFMRAHLQTLTPNPPLNPLTGLPELDWSQPTPASNLYWLHYLLHILLHKRKELRKPPAQSTSSRSRSKGPSGGGGSGIAGFAEEDILAFRELEGLYKVLDCRPRGSKRGATAMVGKGNSWGGGFREGASGFVRWAVREGVVGEEEL